MKSVLYSLIRTPLTYPLLLFSEAPWSLVPQLLLIYFVANLSTITKISQPLLLIE